MSQLSEVVTTKDDLERLVKQETPEFIVQGELASKLKDAVRIKNISKAALALLPAAIAAAALIPATGGISGIAGAGALMGFAAAAGISIPTAIVIITAIAVFGLSLIVAINNDYDISFSVNSLTGECAANFQRKSK